MQQVKLSIRYAQRRELGSVRDLFVNVVSDLSIYNEQAKSGEIEKFCLKELETRLNADPQAISVASLNQRLVGFCITQDQHGPIWIEWYGVAVSDRRCGVGEALIDHLIADLPNRHATKIWCDTRISNDASIRLFQKKRFSQLCLLRNHWYGQDFFLWERGAV